MFKHPQKSCCTATQAPKYLGEVSPLQVHNFKLTDSSVQSEDAVHTLEVTCVPECFAEQGSTLSNGSENRWKLFIKQL